MDIIYELLKKEEAQLTERLKDIREELNKLKGIDTNKVDSNVIQKKNEDNVPNDDIVDLTKYSIPQKFLHTLSVHKRFMKIREIANYIHIQTGENENSIVKQLSRRTKYLKDLNKIVKHQVGKTKKNTFWGSPNWVDSNGNIKEEHVYKNSSIEKNKGELLIDL